MLETGELCIHFPARGSIFRLFVESGIASGTVRGRSCPVKSPSIHGDDRQSASTGSMLGNAGQILPCDLQLEPITSIYLSSLGHFVRISVRLSRMKKNLFKSQSDRSETTPRFAPTVLLTRALLYASGSSADIISTGHGIKETTLSWHNSMASRVYPSRSKPPIPKIVSSPSSPSPPTMPAHSTRISSRIEVSSH